MPSPRSQMRRSMEIQFECASARCAVVPVSVEDESMFYSAPLRGGAARFDLLSSLVKHL